MRASRQNKGGRPRSREPAPGERVSLGLRVTPELKQELDQAAAKSGRSQSQEAELRLENSFRNRRVLDEAMQLAYGRANAGLAFLIADIMNNGKYVASMISNSEDWIDDPTTFRWIVEILNEELFQKLQPTFGEHNHNQKNLAITPEQVKVLLKIQRSWIKSHIGVVIDWVKTGKAPPPPVSRIQYDDDEPGTPPAKTGEHI
jgi:hypothetical protein